MIMRNTAKISTLSFLLVLVFSIFVNAQVPLGAYPVWQSAEEDQYSTGMVWRDVNNDGFIDLFISNGNDIVMAPNRVYVSNRGTLPIFSTWTSNDAQYSGHCAVGDLNDDGYVDLAVSNFIGSGGFSTKNL
jgi:VCBS repeat protein